jgi:osmotically-inducible protein OsmY
MMRKLVPLLLLAAALPVVSGCAGVFVAGAGATAMLADDRRTAGIYVEDENIEWKAVARFNGDFPDAHINATSYNRKLLLTGEVATEEAKRKAGEAAKAIQNVLDVANELAVGANATLSARGNDSLVTTNVKARMVGNGKFSPNHVKVVTEAGVVYLMGIVTTAEGEAAVEVTRTTSGVKRVVKVFEYIAAK